MLGFYAYMQATLGPLIPFLRAELSLNYTVAGFHSSAFALGMILAGLSGEIVANRVGHRLLFWLGGLGMCLGGIILTIGQSATITILGAFIMGLIGTYLLVMIQSLLSDEFGLNRAIALTESNLVASIFAVFAPLMISFSITIGSDWRIALWLGAAVWISMFLLLRTLVFPQRPQLLETKTNASDDSLPAIFWVYWMMVFVGVAIEWCMIFWLADFLVNASNIAIDTASLLVSLLLASVIAGRFLGSILSRYIPTLGLLMLTAILIAIGFPIFWLSTTILGHSIGIGIVGIGMANLFPLALAAASNMGNNQVDKASARITLAAGLAILIVPQTLGTLADQVGIFRAYSVLPILLIALTFMIAYAWYVDRSKI